MLLGGNLARGNARESSVDEVARRDAPAPVAPDDDTRRLQLLDAMLSVEAGAKGRWRIVGAASVVLGATLLTSSFALGHHDDARTVVGGTGGGLLAVGVAMAIPIGGEPASDALDALRRMRAAGGVDTVTRIEAMLEERAERARSQRKVSSSVLLGVGVVATGAGAYLAFSDIAPERREARGVAAALLVGSAAYSLLSVYRFVTPSDVENVRDV